MTIRPVDAGHSPQEAEAGGGDLLGLVREATNLVDKLGELR